MFQCESQVRMRGRPEQLALDKTRVGMGSGVFKSHSARFVLISTTGSRGESSLGDYY